MSTKLVHNYSSHELTPAQERLLQRGWQFCIEQRITNTINIKTDIEINILKLEEVCHSSVHKKICQQINNAATKMLHQLKRKSIRNLGEDEWIALKELKNNNKIVICKADKGNAVVILNQSDYVSKMQSILNNKQFTRTKNNLVKQKEAEMNKLIRELYNKKIINQNLFWQLHSTSTSTPTLYGQTKIHKNDLPMRPIISSIGAYNYNLSKYLANKIAQCKPKSSSYIKDAFEFVRAIQQTTPTPKSTLCSFDIENLYTNVPVNETIELVLDTLYKSEKSTDLSTDRKMTRKLLQIAITAVPFRFQNEYYLQQDGVAMGSPLAPIMADVFMTKIETKLNRFSVNKPVLWLRYVDDIFCLFNTELNKILKFQERINNWHPNLKFTLEIETNQQLPFLDVLVIKKANQFETTIYRKPTHTDLYMLYDSNQPRRYKLGLIKTLIIRIERICSTEDHKKEEISRIHKVLEQNGYPKHIISKGIREARKLINHLNQQQQQQHSIKKNIYFTMNYYGNETLLFATKVKKQCERLIPGITIKFAFKKTNSLKSIFLPIQKGKNPNCNESKLIYKIKCNDCDNVYIRETAREKNTRIQEHKKCIKTMDANSKIFQHVYRNSHQMNFNDTETLGYETEWRRRIIKEAILTQETAGKTFNDTKHTLKVF